MAKQLGFYFDSSACVGCKTCQIACKDKNNLPLGVCWRRVFEYAGGSWVPQGDQWIPNNVFGYNLSLSCNHCENPLCVNACPTTALVKRADGVILINQDQCVGCRYCEWACPYGAPQFDEAKGVMTKCNFCEDLLAQGQNPACVDACPLRALDFGDIAELRAKHGNVSAVEPLPVATITQPHLVITPNRQAQPVGKGTGTILNLPEEL
ncbi:MAG: dimethylsulfoxide reductase subunit B [Chloroflexi bacterium]|nr:dimethylsulfoxide reductase subunit B [Chloroflexota bacterium]